MIIVLCFQSYAFIRQEQLQLLAEKLDSTKPKEVRREALQALCCATPSDVLSCESWSTLRTNLCSALTEPDLSEKVLQFFAKSFSSSPLNVTREIYTCLAKSVESAFLSQRLSFPTRSAAVDINSPHISRLLKQIRLMNDFQKEVTTFWIRHPEKYMEEIIESTFCLLSFHHDHGSAGTEKTLEPVHLLSLLDIKATWFNKWMHGYYSRTVVLRLLERKYKTLIVSALQQCLHFSESFERSSGEAADSHAEDSSDPGLLQRGVFTRRDLEYSFFVHSLCILGKLIIYTNGRKLFPIKIRKHKDPVSLTDLLVILINIMYRHPRPSNGDSSLTGSLSPSCLVMEVLWMLCERTECAADCLLQTPVIETLLTPVVALLNAQQTNLRNPAATLILIADVLARIANTDRGLALFLYEKNLVVAHSEKTFAAHIVVQFTLRLLNKALPSLSESDTSQTLCGAFIFVCRQMYNTCEGLQVLQTYGLHKAIAAAWKKTSSLSERIPTPVSGSCTGPSTQETANMLVWEETLLGSLLNFAATPRGLLLLHVLSPNPSQDHVQTAQNAPKHTLSRLRLSALSTKKPLSQDHVQTAQNAPKHTLGFPSKTVSRLLSALTAKYLSQDHVQTPKCSNTLCPPTSASGLRPGAPKTVSRLRTQCFPEHPKYLSQDHVQTAQNAPKHTLSTTYASGPPWRSQDSLTPPLSALSPNLSQDHVQTPNAPNTLCPPNHSSPRTQGFALTLLHLDPTLVVMVSMAAINNPNLVPPILTSLAEPGKADTYRAPGFKNTLSVNTARWN
ncbi:protein broad-minded-like [Gambusia affinis]|uniref:protein broad-minded-like n=1 Tax=Gambusia affinis TaxID=33528 RepID=UPI001CDD876D|nr:protein broad-minded-like [Gambusia affinis]